MAKVIYVDDNGNQEVLREGNIYKGDILFREDYFATKIWCADDIAMRIEEMYDRDATEEEIADVINTGGGWWGLTDCSDDWYVIDCVITDILGKPDMERR